MTPCPVRPHKNGPYFVARWTTSDGEPRSRGLGKVSRRAAEKACWKIAAEFAVEPGKRDARNAPTLGEWAKAYLALRESELDPRTIQLHDRTLRYLIERFGETRRLDKITPAMADDWKAWLSTQSGTRGTLGPQTVAGHIRTAKVIFKRARVRRHIGTNPFEDISGTAPKVSKDWRQVTRDDLERIMDACPSPGWRSLFALARLAGLRLGEALRLSWADIDWQARRLRVWPEGDETTKQRAREVPIEPRLLEVLQAAWETAAEGSSGPCGEVNTTNIQRNAQRLLTRSGVGVYAKPFHTLRRNLEGEWIKLAPWPTVCSWLGHSPRVAMEHYLRPEEQEYDRVTGPTHLTATPSDSKLRS